MNFITFANVKGIHCTLYSNLMINVDKTFSKMNKNDQNVTPKNREEQSRAEQDGIRASLTTRSGSTSHPSAFSMSIVNVVEQIAPADIFNATISVEYQNGIIWLQYNKLPGKD